MYNTKTEVSEWKGFQEAYTQRNFGGYLSPAAYEREFYARQLAA
jgi:hypothetical protein